MAGKKWKELGQARVLGMLDAMGLLQATGGAGRAFLFLVSSFLMSKNEEAHILVQQDGITRAFGIRGAKPPFNVP